MALQLPYEMPQLFKHSKEVSTGGGKDRIGEVVVAINGTGDFDNIQEAINSLKLGGTILIKEGNYNLKTTLLMSYNNLYLKGSGAGTIIQQASDFAGSKLIDINTKTNIKIENLTLKNTKVNTNYGIYINATNTCIINKVIFDSITDYNVWIQASSRNVIISSCLGNINVLWEGFVAIVDSSKCQVVYCSGLDTATGKINLSGNSDNNVILGNISEKVVIEDATCNKNIVTNNQFNIAIDDSGTDTIIANNGEF